MLNRVRLALFTPNSYLDRNIIGVLTRERVSRSYNIGTQVRHPLPPPFSLFLTMLLSLVCVRYLLINSALFWCVRYYFTSHPSYPVLSYPSSHHPSPSDPCTYPCTAAEIRNFLLFFFFSFFFPFFFLLLLLLGCLLIFVLLACSASAWTGVG